MTPFSEVLQLLRTLTAENFAARHGGQDLLLVEPHEKGRPYNDSSPVHAGALVRVLPREQGKPIPVGRDARAQVLLDHPAISRLHLVLAYTAEGWKVMDRSSNGSYLNDDRMPREQALVLPYGTKVRMGRALVIRLFHPQGFHHYVQSVAGGFAPQPMQNPLGAEQRTADTWRMPAIPPGATAPAPPTAPPAAPSPPQPMEFQFTGSVPGQPAAPTVRFRRDDVAPIPPQAPPGRPSVPRAPQAPGAPGPARPRPPGEGDGLEFEFDFDFDGDGRGGFA